MCLFTLLPILEEALRVKEVEKDIFSYVIIRQGGRKGNGSSRRANIVKHFLKAKQFPSELANEDLIASVNNYLFDETAININA